MNSQKQSLILLPRTRKSREVRKLETERDRALGRLYKLKATRKKKKLLRQRQTFARQVVTLTIRQTQALIDGEI